MKTLLISVLLLSSTAFADFGAENAGDNAGAPADATGVGGNAADSAEGAGSTLHDGPSEGKQYDLVYPTTPCGSACEFENVAQ